MHLNCCEYHRHGGSPNYACSSDPKHSKPEKRANVPDGWPVGKGVCQRNAEHNFGLLFPVEIEGQRRHVCKVCRDELDPLNGGKIINDDEGGGSRYIRYERRGSGFDVVLVLRARDNQNDLLAIPNFKAVMWLPEYWRKGIYADYLSEKLNLGEVDAESIQLLLQCIASEEA